MHDYIQKTRQISFDIERNLLSDECKCIAGIDEAGRGALSGPLVVGLVIYAPALIINPPRDIPESVNDSKKLSASKREKALKIINLNSLYVGLAVISHKIIDDLNINKATEYAVRKLISKAVPEPDVVLMDGNFSFKADKPIRSIIKGDSLSITIASASIAAKVKRDALMGKYESIYPGYFFNKNMGYGTKEHMEAIYKIGPSPIHRKTYNPVKSMKLFN